MSFPVCPRPATTERGSCVSEASSFGIMFQTSPPFVLVNLIPRFWMSNTARLTTWSVW